MQTSDTFHLLFCRCCRRHLKAGEEPTSPLIPSWHASPPFSPTTGWLPPRLLFIHILRHSFGFYYRNIVLQFLYLLWPPILAPLLLVVYKTTAATQFNGYYRRVGHREEEHTMPTTHPAMKRTRDVSRLITLPLCITCIVLFVCICCVVHRDDNKIAVAIAISFHLISRQVDGGGQALLSPCQACRLLPLLLLLFLPKWNKFTTYYLSAVFSLYCYRARHRTTAAAAAPAVLSQLTPDTTTWACDSRRVPIAIT